MRSRLFSNSFAIPIDGNLFIEVEYGMLGGIPMPFVVRLMTRAQGVKMCISRFDSAHLQEPPHRDLLGLRKGNRGKFFYESLDYADVVAYAILDFKKNGHEYYKDFINH
jgi:hypothetical protein